MKFGVAKDIITPDVSMGMSGYGSRYGQNFKDIHDDIYVRCLYTENDSNKLLMVVYDLAFHDFSLTEKIREYVKDKYSLNPEQLILSYTHTHAGPAVVGFSPGEENENYEKMLIDRTKSCIDRCMLNLYKGTVSFCQVEGDWNINRRKTVNGKLVNGPYPEGVTDKVMNMLKYSDQNGVIRALLFNYGCHPVTLGDVDNISSEYPGRVCQILEGKYYGCTPLFFQGAGAHERPKIAFNGKRFIKCRFDNVNELANQIASRIDSAIVSEKFTKLNDTFLTGTSFKMNVPVNPFKKENLIEKHKTAKGFLENTLSYMIDNYEKMPDYLPLNAGIVKMTDDIYITWLSGEVVTEVKDIIHKAIGTDKKLIFIGYADSIGYIPDSTVIEQGGYEGGEAMYGFARKGKFKPEIDSIIYDNFKNACKNL